MSRSREILANRGSACISRDLTEADKICTHLLNSIPSSVEPSPLCLIELWTAYTVRARDSNRTTPSVLRTSYVALEGTAHREEDSLEPLQATRGDFPGRKLDGGSCHDSSNRNLWLPGLGSTGISTSHGPSVCQRPTWGIARTPRMTDSGELAGVLIVEEISPRDDPGRDHGYERAVYPTDPT